MDLSTFYNFGINSNDLIFKEDGTYIKTENKVLKIDDKNKECVWTENKDYIGTVELDNRIKNMSNDIQTELSLLRGELYSKETEINKLKSQIDRTVLLVHNCQNCGAVLNLEENKPIFHCKYCGSTYIIGSARLKSAY